MQTRADIARNVRQGLQLLPFHSRSVLPGACASGKHRVWIDNLPYDTSLGDIVTNFAATWCSRALLDVRGGLFADAVLLRAVLSPA